MSNGNHVNVIGNLTRDPELRFTPSGQATTTFGVAVNRRWQNRQSQEWEEATSFFDIVCWGQLAENVAQSLGRGSRVMVTGRLDQRSWENQDGDRRSKIEITAEEVAPSLRYATVSITKNERRTPDGGGYSSGGGGGGGGYSSGGGGGGYSSNGGGGESPRPAANDAPAHGGSNGSGGSNTYQYDEEPF